MMEASLESRPLVFHSSKVHSLPLFDPPTTAGSPGGPSFVCSSPLSQVRELSPSCCLSTATATWVLRPSHVSFAKAPHTTPPSYRHFKPTLNLLIDLRQSSRLKAVELLSQVCPTYHSYYLSVIQQVNFGIDVPL